MNYGMPTLIEQNTLEESARLCKEIGLDFIELNMNFPQYQIEQLENVKFYQEIAEKYGIFYTIHLDENMNICDFNRAVANAYLDTVKRTIEVGKRLRVPIINMHMNHGIYITLPDKRVQLYEKYNTHYMEAIKKFRRICEEQIGATELKLSIENTDGYREYEKEAIEYLLESDVFTLTWDIGHSHVTQNIDESFLRKHRKRIKHFHIHDATNKNNHLTLGTGQVDLQERLLLAKECEARCVIETKTIEALRESVNWLKERKARESSMKYLLATENNVVEITRLVQQIIMEVYPKYYPKEVVEFFVNLHNEEAIREDILKERVWVLIVNGRVIGTSSYEKNYIKRVYVALDYQGNGYGTLLMQKLEERIRITYDKAILDASLPACIFYEHRGYRTVKHKRNPVNNEVVLVYDIMEKEVKNMKSNRK